MKKSLAMALAASFVMSAAGTVFAAEVPNPFDIKFDGSINVQSRTDVRTNGPAADVTASGIKSTLTLNAEKALTNNLSLYSRFTYQGFSNTTAEDKQADYIDEKYNGTFDAFGFKYQNAGINYVLGSQAMTIGATGIVYDNGWIGNHSLPYALKVNGKSGATDLTAFYAKTNYQNGYENDKFYGVQGQYAINSKTSVGGFYAHDSYGAYTTRIDANHNFLYGKDSINYYGVNVSYKFDNKLGFVAEYIKSSADQDSKGYIGSFNYAFDKNTTAGLSYYNIEDQAAIVDGNWASATTAPFSNAKGYIVSVGHKLGTDVTLNASYDTQDKINAVGHAGASVDRNRTKVGVTVNF